MQLFLHVTAERSSASSQRCMIICYLIYVGFITAKDNEPSHQLTVIAERVNIFALWFTCNCMSCICPPESLSTWCSEDT